MGILEELILMAKEAIDEANQRGRRPPTARAPESEPEPESEPAEHSEEELEDLRRTLARRAAQARIEQEQAERAAADQRDQQQRQREAQERERQRQVRSTSKSTAAQVVHATGAVDPQRIARLVHQPQALREMMVLSEVLGKPLALRKRR
jgi:hypothetical protein